jgi:hypothetical protein
MLTVSFLSLVLAVPAQAPASSSWLTSYDKATERAVKEKKDLFIVFQEKGDLNEVLNDPQIVKELKRFVCLRVPTRYQHEGKKLLDYPALEDMQGKAGLAIVSMHDEKLATHWQVISAHPLVSSRYRWVPSYGVEQVNIILNLPAKATLSQRSMIYAVRVHPEEPQSVYGECHPAFLGHAESHSKRQASMQRQHHANLGAAMSRLQGETGVGLGGASEVVAESWGRFVGGENVLEAAFSCIDAWRHSSGHWSSVAGRHRFFGYDIAQGDNGKWYATGIFAR